MINNLELDLAEDVEFKDIYIGFKSENFRVKLGNIKIPFSLDTYSSSKYASFMEDSLTDTFVENRKFGGELKISQKSGKSRANIFLGIFQNSIDENRDDDDEVQRAILKTTYGYKLGKKHILHLGASYLYSNFDGNSRRYKQDSVFEDIENRLINLKIVNIDSTHDFGLETLYINRSFHFQAEFFNSAVNDYMFSGFYAQMGYFLFGGSKKFKLKDAKFSKPKAKNDLEIAFRYSNLNLTELEDVDKTQEEYNFALNWYINKNLKLLTNYNITYPNNYKYDGMYQSLQTRMLILF